jgi:molybdate/tungstate transport system substrate-binding protein
VSVIYAASLTSVFERRLGPGFEGATGFSFQGEGRGSVAIANLIRDKVRRPDVFVSADPAADQSLQGSANGNYVSWWLPFARTELVIGWSPKGSFTSDFEAARSGKRTWESVLEQPGLKLGRTDPELDPKGYRTLFLLQLDEQRTGQSGLSQKILGAPGNPAQIFPEEQLVARLQAGQLDAGFFYSVEAMEADLPYLRLPAEVNQGDPAQAARYAAASYTSKKGQTFKGSPVLYTVTIPSTVRNRQGAEAFVQYLLAKPGQSQLNEAGLPPVQAQVEGDAGTLPASLKPFIKA